MIIFQDIINVAAFIHTFFSNVMHITTKILFVRVSVDSILKQTEIEIESRNDRRLAKKLI